MNKLDRYLDAAVRDNTRRSYRAAVEHFEVSWGGFLPATADSIARYLADYAEQHSINTLRQRLAALGQWHTSQGFPDPTKAPLVRQMLKGIRAVHPAQERQAAALTLEHLQRTVDALHTKAAQAQQAHCLPELLRARRDVALLLIGFWRGFRGDELARLRVEHIQAQAGVGMQLYLAQSKGDRQGRGVSHRTPALKSLCPVQAYIDWISVAGIARGPVFRKLDRWGNLGEQALNSGSLIVLLRRIFADAGLPASLYSSHSLRRGFATWASGNGWDMKALMAHVGWRDVKSALRYVDASVSFGELEVLPARRDVLTAD
ncbi:MULTISPECIES: site-specific integrase [Pseudomonas]|nr:MULTISPECIES: site-specific integrase [Pseudomonas]MCO7504425.1 site-specific integrase [Pseudomonas sp. VE 267-6A]MCO7529635.1 site-specific integrase [Pseudomonas sp. 2]MDD1953692.1 site-specific integrase [Pseudomonas sp. 8209]